MSNECQGETRLGHPSDGQIEDSENQVPSHGRSYSIEAISMDPRKILSLESEGELNGRSGSVLRFSPDSDSPHPISEMSEWDMLNEGQDISFPPRGPSQYQD